MDQATIIEEVIEAQADLQTALGMFRLNRNFDPAAIEDRLVRSLARHHTLLARLGRPMYDPATHPEVPTP